MSEKKTISRVEMLSPEQAKEAAEAVGVPDELSSRNIFRLLLRRPVLAKAVNDLLYSLLLHGTFDDRLRELVIMRIGWATGSDYEWTQHWTVAQIPFGVSTDDLLAVRDWQNSDRFGEVERAILAATDEALETGTLSEETWASCKRHLGDDDACIELVASLATWRFISQLARSLHIPVEDDVDSWPPDGVAPPGAI